MEEHDILSTVAQIMNNDQSFHRIIRFLDSGTRNTLVAAHLRNNFLALNVLRMYMSEASSTSIVMNIPINNDFLEPIPIVPSAAQVTAGVEQNVNVTDTNCSICQEEVTSATRIRHCNHCFHDQCIQSWFTMNPRCPVCRHDIRDLHSDSADTSNDSDMHSDSE